MTEITITGKLGNIYSFTGDYSLRKGDKVYTEPPHRPWVGLTDEEKQACIRQVDELGKYSTHTVADDERLLIDSIEAKLREKNK